MLGSAAVRAASAANRHRQRGPVVAPPRERIFTLKRRVVGSTLFEVLVSIVVLSLALLGSGALQGKALKSSMDSRYLAKAGFLLDDMAERIRTNSSRTQPASTNYNMLSSMTQYATLSASYKAATCTGATANCTPANMAAYDVATWLSAVNDATKGLPDGAAKVSWSGKDATITLRWRPSYVGEGNCDSTGQIGGQTRDYRCLQLVVTVP
jgi:type IV pilus modification protein PilV